MEEILVDENGYKQFFEDIKMLSVMAGTIILLLKNQWGKAER